MIRMGGPGGGAPRIDPEEESRMANIAVVGNTTIFGIIVLAINVAPYLLEQFGIETLK